MRPARPVAAGSDTVFTTVRLASKGSDTGNLAIGKKVLAAFRKLTGNSGLAVKNIGASENRATSLHATRIID